MDILKGHAIVIVEATIVKVDGFVCKAGLIVGI
jgi:hypothetical protein